MLKPTRYFCVWEYLVSHSQLLIRSVKDENDSESNNIDLIFGGVSHLFLNNINKGFMLTETDCESFLATQEELVVLANKYQINLNNKNKFFVLRSGEERDFIGAAFLRISENQLGPMESSLTHF